MKAIVRKAEIHDCEAIMTLVKELAIYEKAPNEVTVSMEEFKDAGFGPLAVWKAFVAELNDTIVGISLFYIRYSTWKGRRLYLEDLIVNESYRGQGIGKLLFEHTISYAKEEKYSGMMWQVLDWNKPAINFYKKYDSTFDDGWVNVNLNF